jgi:sulfite exporter TauE/SafE
VKQAYAIGVVHGMGGTAGVGLLLLAAIRSHVLAVSALALFAFCTALSMALLSTGWGAALGSRPVRRCFHRIAPALGAASLAFGVWYALGAQGVVPYAF